MCSGQRTLLRISKGNEGSEVLSFRRRWKSAKIFFYLETAFSFFTNECINNNTKYHIKAFLLIFRPGSSKSRNPTSATKKQWKWLTAHISAPCLVGLPGKTASAKAQTASLLQTHRKPKQLPTAGIPPHAGIPLHAGPRVSRAVKSRCGYLTKWWREAI